MVLINFLTHSLQIAILLKTRGKDAFFSKSHKNAVIRVFWHAEFISALKTELNPTVFEKTAKNKIKYLITIIFNFFVIFSKSYQQNCIKTRNHGFQMERSQIHPKWYLSIFWPIASRLSYYSKGKNSGKSLFFSSRPIKMRLLGYFGMQNSFLH